MEQIIESQGIVIESHEMVMEGLIEPKHQRYHQPSTLQDQVAFANKSKITCESESNERGSAVDGRDA